MPLGPNGEVELDLPASAVPLSFGFQGSVPVMWCLVPDTAALRERRRFCIVGTGHRVPTGFRLEHIGTATVNGLVLHLFEVLP